MTELEKELIEAIMANSAATSAVAGALVANMNEDTTEAISELRQSTAMIRESMSHIRAALKAGGDNGR